MWTEGQILQSGKYRVIRRIGSGGFGLTYLAEDLLSGWKVVIKTPNDSFQADQDYEKNVRRVQREWKALASLKHTNVVGVVGSFEEREMPCLVMTYVKGDTLNKRINKGKPLANNEAIQIFQKLAAALHQVHRVGIFHCDIHPGNIILQLDGEPVLIDFGSAKLFQPSTLTVTTTVNQSYSPYEQQNRKNKPKATLDVYALAATLFFSVTGEKPPSSSNRKLFDEKVVFPLTAKMMLNQQLKEAILKGMALEEDNRPSDMRSWARLLTPEQTYSRSWLLILALTASQQITKVKQGVPSFWKAAVSEFVKKKSLLNLCLAKCLDSSLRVIRWMCPILLRAVRYSLRRTAVQLKEIPLSSSKVLEILSRSSYYPWSGLSLFLLCNVPTGVSLWILGKGVT